MLQLRSWGHKEPKSRILGGGLVITEDRTKSKFGGGVGHECKFRE